MDVCTEVDEYVTIRIYKGHGQKCSSKMKPRLRTECTVSSVQEFILASCCLSPMTVCDCPVSDRKTQK